MTDRIIDDALNKAVVVTYQHALELVGLCQTIGQAEQLLKEAIERYKEQS